MTEDEYSRIQLAHESYKRNWEEEFSQEKVTQQLMGEQNTFRYLPLKNIVFRVLPGDKADDMLLVIRAANTARTPLTISINASDEKLKVLNELPTNEFTLLTQSDEEFVADMDKFDRVRCCSSVLPESYYLKAAKLGKYIAVTKPLTEGRLELLHYLKEQSISYEYHRYGSFTEEDAVL